MKRPYLELKILLLSDPYDSEDLDFAAANSTFQVLRQLLYIFFRSSLEDDCAAAAAAAAKKRVLGSDDGTLTGRPFTQPAVLVKFSLLEKATTVIGSSTRPNPVCSALESNGKSRIYPYETWDTKYEQCTACPSAD